MTYDGNCCYGEVEACNQTPCSNNEMAPSKSCPAVTVSGISEAEIRVTGSSDTTKYPMEHMFDNDIATFWHGTSNPVDRYGVHVTFQVCLKYALVYKELL